jgi:biopolymer transport protein ExbB/TolQ
MEVAAQQLGAKVATIGAVRPAWVRWSSLGLAIFSAAILCAAVVIGSYNVRYSYHRISDIVQRDETAAAQLGGRADLVPEWVAPFMQDLSVVSPGLVAFTAACMLFSALLLIRFPAATPRIETVHFPFPVTYKTYYVQMGLLGTIIGFVIAFSEIDLGAERQTLVLIEALGTALWSTLTALLLAYGVCPVVELLYQRLRAPAGRARTDTRSALDVLRQRTVDAAQSLAMLTDSANAVSGELDLHHLENRIGRIEGKLSAIGESLAELTGTTRELREYREEMEGNARMVESFADTTEQRLSQLDEQLRRLEQSVATVVSAAEELKMASERLQEEDLPALGERLDTLERRVSAIVKTFKDVPE